MTQFEITLNVDLKDSEGKDPISEDKALELFNELLVEVRENHFFTTEAVEVATIQELVGQQFEETSYGQVSVIDSSE